MIYICVYLFIGFLNAYSHNPFPENVGIGQQGTCFQCHNTWPENANGDIQIYGIPSVIEPGARYEVDVVVSNQYNSGSWGFQIASVIGQYGVPQGGPLVQAGTWELINPDKTILETANDVDYIKQTLNGIFAGQNGAATWSFIWTAPEEYYGGITFAATGIAGDGELGNLGDYSYSTELITVIVPEYTDDFSNVNYYTQIEPIFNAYCLACHNGEFQYNNNGLVMDSYIDLMAGGNSGPPIIPFDSENSILYKTITGTSYDDLGIPSMPYFSFLIPEFLRNTIKAWIDEGANEFPCMLGDYDFDNDVNVSDVVQIVGCILNQNCNTDSCADISGDGSLSISDIILIIDIILEG